MKSSKKYGIFEKIDLFFSNMPHSKKNAIFEKSMRFSGGWL